MQATLVNESQSGLQSGCETDALDELELSGIWVERMASVCYWNAR